MVIPKWLSNAIGKTYITKKPFFIFWDPELHKIKGNEIREIILNLKQGDIVLRKYDGYLNSIFTPGFWSHAAIAVSNRYIVHAIGKGVIQEDILDFCRTDHVCILRFKNPDKDLIKNAIKKAKEMVEDHVEYDFEFADDNGKVYCTEFVNECFNGIFNDYYTKILDKNILFPDQMKNDCPFMETIVEFKH